MSDNEPNYGEFDVVSPNVPLGKPSFDNEPVGSALHSPPPEQTLKNVRGLLHEWEHNAHRQSPSHILNDLVDLLNANQVPDPDQLPKLASAGRHLLADVERDLILRTVEEFGGNRTRAAHVLGISVRTLRNKLHQYNDGTVPLPRQRPDRAKTGPSPKLDARGALDPPELSDPRV